MKMKIEEHLFVKALVFNVGAIHACSFVWLLPLSQGALTLPRCGAVLVFRFLLLCWSWFLGHFSHPVSRPDALHYSALEFFVRILVAVLGIGQHLLYSGGSVGGAVCSGCAGISEVGALVSLSIESSAEEAPVRSRCIRTRRALIVSF
jgi:hypothetical protein